MEKYAYSRRDFLKQLGLVTAGGVLAACAPPAAAPTAQEAPAAAAPRCCP